jgi:NADH-quinone oxidoreductase subunit A
VDNGFRETLHGAEVAHTIYDQAEWVLRMEGMSLVGLVQVIENSLGFIKFGLHPVHAINLASYKLTMSEATGVATDVHARASLALLQNLEANHFLFQITAILVALLCGVLALVSQLFSRDMVQDAEKKSTYECGFSPYDSATRLPFDVHFYVVGIMFLVFDVELALLTTAAVLAAALPWTALVNIAAFVIILTVGFIYEWARGALRWEAKAAEPI